MQAMKKLPFATLGLLFTLVLVWVAELYRFKGFLLLDLWAPLFTFGLIGWKTLQGRWKTWPPTLLAAGLFLGVGAGSLLIHSGSMAFGDFAQSAFYLVRWASLFLLSIIAMNEAKTHRSTLQWGLYFLGFFLAIAGFIQLKLVPDFSYFAANYGWDPHYGRVLSTWFDPNFLGGFLGFILLLMAGHFFDEKNRFRQAALVLMGLVILAALYATLSRSAYLLLATGLLVFGLVKSPKTLVVGALAIAILIPISERAQDRIVDLISSIQSVTSETYTLPDPSARLRLGSWQGGIDLFLDSPLIGQGYNRYKFAALEEGILSDAEAHHASGSDSSLLTILATTGILGFLPFFSLYLVLAAHALRHRKDGFSAGFLAGLCGLFIHSIFVNSLLLPVFMAPFWLAAGLLPPLRYKRN